MHYQRSDSSRLSHNVSEALELLPSSSPHLQTLQLAFSFNYYFKEVLPRQAYLDFIAAINHIRLPHLRSLHISITCNERYCMGYHDETLPADLSKVLAAHPMLVRLSYDGCGLAPITKTTAQQLTQIRSFAGDFEHSSAILSEQSNVQRVKLIFIEAHMTNKTPLVEATPPALLCAVTHVTIRAADVDGGIQKYRSELDSKFYSRLASLAPTITYLDMALGHRLKHFRECIMSLPQLEYLRVQEYRRELGNKFKKNPVLAFPAADYVVQLNEFLTVLSQLDQISVWILADSMGGSDCGSDNEYSSDEEPGPWDYRLGDELHFCLPQMQLVYHFSVTRHSSTSHVSLADTEIQDPQQVEYLACVT
ncbi:hypothetical protein C8J57DRAFT_1537160 [Mycena rebaudengoi]|nr:hypothetical protein C8J57DRAFT_1537160 [Mycena rebaudengoi]